MDKAEFEKLKDEFRKMDLSAAFSREVLNYLSTKSEKGAFPPYVPFLGKLFDEYGVLVYCTAQNIPHNNSLVKRYSDNFEKLNCRLEYGDDFNRHYGETDFDISDVDIAPFGNGVIPALIAVFIMAKTGTKIPAEHILDYCGVTNYYKFSLHTEARDINPDGKISHFNNQDQYKYWALNDKLVRQELGAISPKYVISFNGYKLRMLASYSIEFGYTLYSVNDPSWILRGASGKLNTDGEWGIEYQKLDENVAEFISSYTRILKDDYKGKVDGVKAYLAHYYNIFKQEG